MVDQIECSSAGRISLSRNCISMNMRYFNGIHCISHVYISGSSLSHFLKSFQMCLFFIKKKRIYPCKCNKVFFNKIENKINRLQQKHGGPSLLFVISSLESPLPLHKKKGSVQSTLFFMSNARQMWLAFGDSRCSPCASAAFCLFSIL